MTTTIETLLASPDEADRKRAIVQMAKYPSGHHLEQIQTLAESDASVDVRFFARRVLGFLRPSPKPDPGPEPGVDAAGLHRVFQTGTAQEKVMLVRELVGKNVRDAVPALLEILSRVGGPSADIPLDQGQEVIVSALLIAIGSLEGERRLETILPYLEHRSPRVRANTIEALEWARRKSAHPEATLLKAYPYILSHLADSDNRVRANAAWALGVLDPQAVRETLHMMIHSNRPPMQASAAFAFRHLAEDPGTRVLPSDADVRLLTKLLDSPNGSVRKQTTAALEALAARGIEAAREILADHRPALPDPKLESIEILQEELSEHERQCRQLKETLGDPDPEARIQAIGAAVDRLGPSVGPVIVEHAARETDTRVVQRLLSALGQIRFRPGLALLRRSLTHPDDRCRANAVEAIGRLEDEEVLHDLISMLDDPHHRVRANAAVVLRNLSQGAAMRTLLRLAESSDEMSQKASVYAMGQMGDPVTVALLERLERSKSPEVAARSRKLKVELTHRSLRENRIVRVFVSSTFRDMHAERDHLVSVRFPELRDRLAGLGLEFFDVDLRWGVPAQGADNERANSWAYCKR